eukprot:TRINITY_DN17103_c0_g1_i1.p1 TRINITY_DN17103_c0_g1~~TRINITY_DN17103_c0_g1_i1.p1  ORF type:complete len:306 (-),score=34.81 TRINITY_DN17103_c0_g1_i1:6-893(-)
MAPFNLWLHALHGGAKDVVSPLHVAEVGSARSVADRFSALAETAHAIGIRDDLRSTGMQVYVTSGGLYALDHRGDRCLKLPLALSTIVHCEFTRLPSAAQLDGAVGLLAYASPVPSHVCSGENIRITQSNAAADSDNVWVFVVTSMGDSNVAGNVEAQTSILQLAMEEFGVHGAIRGDTIGLKSSSVTLGAGAFASVQLMQRDLPAQFTMVGDHSRSRVSSEVRLRMTRGDRPEANKKALAAKVINAQVSSDDVFAEASYLIAVGGHPNVPRFFGMFCLSCAGHAPSWVLMTAAT